MRERYQSMTTADGWIICGKCGHKLAKSIGEYKNITLQNKRNISTNTSLKIEFKCPSCKEINILEVER